MFIPLWYLPYLLVTWLEIPPPTHHSATHHHFSKKTDISYHTEPYLILPLPYPHSLKATLGRYLWWNLTYQLPVRGSRTLKQRLCVITTLWYDTYTYTWYSDTTLGIMELRPYTSLIVWFSHPLPFPLPSPPPSPSPSPSSSSSPSPSPCVKAVSVSFSFSSFLFFPLLFFFFLVALRMMFRIVSRADWFEGRWR